MSLESSISSLGPSRDISAKPMPSHDPSSRAIKGSVPDGGKMEKVAQSILSLSSSSRDAPAKLAGRQIKPAKELVDTLTAYSNKQSSITHAEVAQLILHNNQTLFKEMVKKPEIGTLLAAVGKKYQEEAQAAKEKPELIKMVSKELKKIKLADSHKYFKQSENIKALGREIEGLLTNYNELLLKAPSDIITVKLINRMGKLITDNLAFFNSHSVESLIIGNNQAKKLTEQLKMLRSTLQQVPDAQKSPVTKQREGLVSKILSKLPKTKKVSHKKDETEFSVNPQEKFVYISPTLLFGGAKIAEDQELNFALVKTDGKQKLIPVTRRRFGREYTTYEGTALEALLKIAQDKGSNVWHSDRHYGSPINHFLKHPNNAIISEEEFFKFILEKDEAGTPRICTLNSASTLEALNIIKEKNITINLNEKTPTKGTLFTLWAGKGNPDITKVMLELDPSVIEQTQEQVKSAFVEAVLNGSKEEADLLIDAIVKKGIVLSQEELWIQRAFKNDCAFSEGEFKQLDQELKIKIFFAANAFGSEDIVKKLKPLGMDTVPLFWPGPSVLAYNMDIVTTRNVMEAFLKGLKQAGLLLTAEEFSKLNKSKYISKRDQIGRIQGNNFIKKLVKENGLNHIKVPKKIAVINEGLESISFRADSSLELIPKEDQLTIYAERIKPVNRKLSLKEAIELMIILEKTGYSDFSGQNFFFCEDGIYIIDTEYKDFSPTRPKFESIKSLKDYVDPKYAKKFLEEYEKRKEAYDKEKELREAQEEEYSAAFENPYTRLTTGYVNHEFAFPLASLV